METEPTWAPQWWVGGDHLSEGTIAQVQADNWHHTIILPQVAAAADPFHGATPGQRMVTSSRLHLAATEVLLQTESVPSALIVLGDRFETFAVALAAFYYGVPLVHLGGGDVTEGGCVDDQLRNALTALATLHGCFSAQSAQRLQQAGVPAERVVTMGSPLVDTLQQVALIPRTTLCTELGLTPNEPIALLTQHPIPAEGEATVAGLRETLDGLAQLGIQVVATAPNADGYGQAMCETLETWVAGYNKARLVPTLGRQGYVSWLAACDVVVGNSSSGLLETPYFKKPSITVGPRQQGRERACNVVAVPYGAHAVAKAVEFVLGNPEFQQQLAGCVSPFGTEPAAPKLLAAMNACLLAPAGWVGTSLA